MTDQEKYAAVLTCLSPEQRKEVLEVNDWTKQSRGQIIFGPAFNPKNPRIRHVWMQCNTCGNIGHMNKHFAWDKNNLLHMADTHPCKNIPFEPTGREAPPDWNPVFMIKYRDFAATLTDKEREAANADPMIMARYFKGVPTHTQFKHGIMTLRLNGLKNKKRSAPATDWDTPSWSTPKQIKFPVLSLGSESDFSEPEGGKTGH